MLVIKREIEQSRASKNTGMSNLTTSLTSIAHFLQEYKLPIAAVGVAAAAVYIHCRWKRGYAASALGLDLGINGASPGEARKRASELVVAIAQSTTPGSRYYSVRQIAFAPSASSASSATPTPVSGLPCVQRVDEAKRSKSIHGFAPIEISSNSVNHEDERVMTIAKELDLQFGLDRNSNDSNTSPNAIGIRIEQLILRDVARSLIALAEFKQQLEQARAIAFDKQNEAHVVALEKYWSYLAPGTPLHPHGAANVNRAERQPSSNSNRIDVEEYKQRIVSPKWEEWAGFQGPDPGTDIRGGGELALRNLCAFAATYGAAARSMCELAKEQGIKWFGLSIASINVTAQVLRLVSEHKLDNYIVRRAMELGIDTRNSSSSQSALELESNSTLWSYQELIFSELHAGVLFRLQRKWLKVRPPNVMSFSSIFQEVLRAFELDVRAGRFAPPQPGEEI